MTTKNGRNCDTTRHLRKVASGRALLTLLLVTTIGPLVILTTLKGIGFVATTVVLICIGIGLLWDALTIVSMIGFTLAVMFHHLTPGGLEHFANTHG